MASAANTSATFPKVCNNTNLIYTSADGTTPKIVYTGTDPFSRIDFVRCFTDSLVDLICKATVVDNSSVETPLGLFTVKATSGTVTTVPWTDVLPLLSLNTSFLKLGCIMKLNLTVALAAGKSLWVTTNGGDY